MHEFIAMMGTSDQSCWLAEACKVPSLDIRVANKIRRTVLPARLSSETRCSC